MTITNAELEVGGWVPVHIATGLGDARPLKALLDTGVDIQARDKVGRTPLHMAAG